MKVSFDKNSRKIERFNDKATIVTLRGTMRIPKFWSSLPEEIIDWCENHKDVEFVESWGLNKIIIKVQGKTIRHEEDEDNPVLAERIAESKAKIRLFKFMYTLVYKIIEYYSKLLYGSDKPIYGVVNKGVYGQLLKYNRLFVMEHEHLKNLMGT